MKNRKGLIISKKMHDINYLNSRLEELCKRDSKLQHFFDFDCDPIFKGQQLADFNMKIYNKDKRENDRKIETVEHLIERAQKENKNS